MARSYNIIVTGGARRLGAAVVRRLVARGHRVVIHHHRSGDEARALAAGLGDGAVPIAAALADPDGLGAFVADARAALGGPIDGLVTLATSFRFHEPPLDSAGLFESPPGANVPLTVTTPSIS